MRDVVDSDQQRSELRKIRESQGFSLRSKAREVGVSPTHLSNLERNRVSPSLGMLRALAKAYGIPVSYALTLFVESVPAPAQRALADGAGHNDRQRRGARGGSHSARQPVASLEGPAEA